MDVTYTEVMYTPGRDVHTWTVLISIQVWSSVDVREREMLKRRKRKMIIGIREDGREGWRLINSSNGDCAAVAPRRVTNPTDPIRLLVIGQIIVRVPARSPSTAACPTARRVPNRPPRALPPARMLVAKISQGETSSNNGCEWMNGRYPPAGRPARGIRLSLPIALSLVGRTAALPTRPPARLSVHPAVRPTVRPPRRPLAHPSAHTPARPPARYVAICNNWEGRGTNDEPWYWIFVPR